VVFLRRLGLAMHLHLIIYHFHFCFALCLALSKKSRVREDQQPQLSCQLSSLPAGGQADSQTSGMLVKKRTASGSFISVTLGQKSRLDLSAFSHEQGTVLLYTEVNPFSLLSSEALMSQTSKTNRCQWDRDAVDDAEVEANLVGKILEIPASSLIHCPFLCHGDPHLGSWMTLPTSAWHTTSHLRDNSWKWPADIWGRAQLCIV